MPSTAAAQLTTAIPEGKEFIRGWIVPNLGLIDYGQAFYHQGEQDTVAKDSKDTLGEYFESRWRQYGKLAKEANNLFVHPGRAAEKLADIAESAHAINRDLQAMPEKFPAIFALRPPVKSLKTREGLLYAYWRRPVEELYTKTAAAAHVFGSDRASARGLNVLLSDFETDAFERATGKPTKNGFNASLDSYFRAYVEIIETLRAGQNPGQVEQVYRAYGDLMLALTNLTIAKYPAAKGKLAETLANQIDERYDAQGQPTFGHTACCFYSRWNPNPGKTETMEQIRGLVKRLTE